MKIILACLLTILVSTLCFVDSAFTANDVQIEATWAWNGTDATTQGFRFYLDGIVVQEVVNPAARSSTWNIALENGNHMFTMAAYGEDWESAKSPEYKFEYLYVDNNNSRPAPMVIIRIN